MTLALPLTFGMQDDERSRLTGGNGRSRRRDRAKQRDRYDPMDALVWAAVFVMVGVTVVYVVLLLRVAFTPNFKPPDGAVQGLVLVVPIASGIALLRRERDRNDQ